MPERHPIRGDSLRLLHRSGRGGPISALSLAPLEPVLVLDLFPDERAALLAALRSLTDEQWTRPTACEGWSVKDIAQHLFADDLGRLSRGRDAWPGIFEPTSRDTFDAELLTFINRQNEAWVEATRRLSPLIIIGLLEWSGRETQNYFESIDPFSLGMGVSWAGESESPNWFDLAREYTERWHHQAQIKEGTGLPILYEPRLFAPVLATFVRALPHTYRNVSAPEGAHVDVRITGEGGGSWSLVRQAGAWHLVQPVPGGEDAKIEMDQEIAWRLFTKGIGPSEAQKRATLSGDEELAAHALNTVSIVA